MKKGNNNGFKYLSILALIIGYAGIFKLLSGSETQLFTNFIVPAEFPSRKGLLIIWGFLFILWGIGELFVYTIPLKPRRARNIFLNSIILVLGIFIWNFILFGSLNLLGALAISIAILILAIVVWLMYLVIHRYGGYLFTPMIIWLVFLLYLNIMLIIRN